MDPTPPPPIADPRAAPPFVVIGNPANRRVTLFQAALARQGLPPATVIPWLDVATDERAIERGFDRIFDRAVDRGFDRAADRAFDCIGDRPALVRIDSPGEDARVEHALLALGHDAARAAGVSVVDPREAPALLADRGRIVCPRQHHLGLLAALDRIDAALGARPHLRALSAPAAIAELFDKRITSRRYAALGVPVPEILPAAPGTTPDATSGDTSGSMPGAPSSPASSSSSDVIADRDTLRARVRAAGWRAAWVKLSSGSSASCLGVYFPGDAGHPDALMTTVEPTPAGWYNSLRVRRLCGRPMVEVLEFLLREGSQIERHVPKARLDGHFFDCRVLCVAGEPAFTVVRQSRHPITNLHLGGRRGDPDALGRVLPPALAAAAASSCRTVARAHACLHVGVDLLYELGWRGHRVVEANAFGDLLPGLERDGLSVYEWQIRAALAPPA